MTPELFTSNQEDKWVWKEEAKMYGGDGLFYLLEKHYVDSSGVSYLGEIKCFESEEDRLKFFYENSMLEYVKLMCELQKQECVKAYNNSTSQFKVTEDILKAPLPPDLI